MSENGLPNVFAADKVRLRLANTAFARVRYSAETGSTNDDAAACLGREESYGETFVADYQSAGRGQRGRRWFAPPGAALMFTAILPEPIETSALWAVPFWCALGVADGIEAATGIRVNLQWPNDLLLDTRKCCGILGVSRVDGELAHVGCGVGLNVTRPEHDDDLATVVPPPAFLSDAFSTTPRETILAEILLAFDRSFRRLASPRTIARLWEQRANLDGTPYRMDFGDGLETLDAIARRLGDDGALIVDDGTRERSIALAEARVRR
jgi:BirA family biotin operon repressor/biotin-[acetyl-CoA-carboxylase] ligase